MCEYLRNYLPACLFIQPIAIVRLISRNAKAWMRLAAVSVPAGCVTETTIVEITGTKTLKHVVSLACLPG